MTFSSRLSQSQDIAAKVALVFNKRAKVAQQQYAERMQKAYDAGVRPLLAKPLSPQEIWSQWFEYSVDTAQRSVLFWDTMRQRGNEFLEHARQGLPPVLHFDYEMVVDGRRLARPVNYAMVRILPPAGTTVDAKRRPYLIIDPRAGHGPGIGGFKDDSQVGVALRAGHPVYFVIFFRDPEPGQTLLDVCDAEKVFVRRVRELHPDSAKPAIVGNCQGGWAAMMLAASDPEETGPIVINGAPMSYWGGAWSEGEGDNPMRYSGGNLGGTWLASFTADLGAGIFDGAHLVQNFENLNPANTFWDKYYNLYRRADTEPPRFLEFERWWGGFYLMNREEIEWITRNLFVGNRLWTGDKGARGGAFDLRDIKSPIVLFASMGDNITPPQQAFNWVADVYGSTEEIKARGQVIVGLLHQDVGHLGIFVSGKVATKEHRQIVSVLKSIEALPPGLYGMEIEEHKGRGGEVEYSVEFREQRLEDVVSRLNRFERQDEQPFEAVAALSEFNQRAYELFAQPLVQAMSSEYTAKLARQLHPLRAQRWGLSDLNPWLAWLGPAAAAVKASRRPATTDNALSKVEGAVSEAISASLEYYRAMRDAMSEAVFFQTYGNVFSLYLADKAAGSVGAEPIADPRELPFVKSALAAIDQGGYPEALARVAYLLARKGEPLLLSRLELKQEFVREYRHLLPDVPIDQWRRIRGEQEIVARYEPERALASLPKLLADPRDRERLATLLRALQADERLRRAKPTSDQIAMLESIGEVLEAAPSTAKPARAPRRRPAAKRKPAKR
jgi:pimeloyl-ACP methyl ester carboxylesterase